MGGIKIKKNKAGDKILYFKSFHYGILKPSARMVMKMRRHKIVFRLGLGLLRVRFRGQRIPKKSRFPVTLSYTKT